MKKFLVSILAVFYLASSMGATVHLHYCMGKLVSWGLIDHPSDKCDTCGMQKKVAGKDSLSTGNHCCKDVHKEIRANKEQKTPQSEFQVLQLLIGDLFLQNKVQPEFHPASDDLLIPPTHAPPYIAKQEKYLRNRNFRI